VASLGAHGGAASSCPLLLLPLSSIPNQLFPRLLWIPLEISCQPRNGTQPPVPSTTPIAVITTSTEAAKQPPEESSSILSGGGHWNFLRSKHLSSVGQFGREMRFQGVEDGERCRVLLATRLNKISSRIKGYTVDSGIGARLRSSGGGIGAGGGTQGEANESIQSNLTPFSISFTPRLPSSARIFSPFSCFPLFPRGKDIIPELMPA
jgi:hypothetical protein